MRVATHLFVPSTRPDAAASCEGKIEVGGVEREVLSSALILFFDLAHVLSVEPRRGRTCGTRWRRRGRGWCGWRRLVIRVCDIAFVHLGPKSWTSGFGWRGSVLSRYARRALDEQEMQSLRYILGLKGLRSVTLGGDLAVSAERFLHVMTDTRAITSLHIDGHSALPDDENTYAANPRFHTLFGRGRT